MPHSQGANIHKASPHTHTPTAVDVLGPEIAILPLAVTRGVGLSIERAGVGTPAGIVVGVR